MSHEQPNEFIAYLEKIWHRMLASASHLCIPSTPFLTTVFPNGSGLFKHNNVPCHTDQELIRNVLHKIEHLWDILDKLILSIAATPHLQDSTPSEVFAALMGQSCFEGNNVTYTILFWWF